MLTVPKKITVVITGRRLAGTPQPNTAVVIGYASDITYDIQSLQPGVALSLQNITPSARIVSPHGEPVRIEAAAYGDEATLLVRGNERRLLVREGIVFGGCNP